MVKIIKESAVRRDIRPGDKVGPYIVKNIYKQKYTSGIGWEVEFYDELGLFRRVKQNFNNGIMVTDDRGNTIVGKYEWGE